MTTDALLSLASDLRVACQRVSRRVRFESSPELAPHLVSALANLRTAPLTPGDLAETERVSAPSMTRTINCLEERGLVTRENHPTDGRSKVVSITTEGLAVLERTRRARDDWMVDKLEGLTTEERTLLGEATKVLERVVKR